MKAPLSKKKLLGQYFSGDRIADTLYDLLGSPRNVSVIDPMCGVGHLLRPFSMDNNARILGVEIDETAYMRACEQFKLLNNCIFFNDNAFAESSIKNYDANGYDIVITNPPYIRTLVYEKGIKVIPGFLSKSEINSNLTHLIESISTLNAEEKTIALSAMNDLSGLGDIAVQAWILCMSLVKPGGKLAMVVPESWLSREYSNPVVYMLKQLFEIESIVNDVNSCWFEGTAEVKTALVVCRRSRSIDINHCIRIADLYKEASDENRLFSFLDKESSVANYLFYGQSIKGICDLKCIKQSEFGNAESAAQISNIATSKLNDVISLSSTKLVSLGDYGICYGQGLRTGANAFFVLQKDGILCRSVFEDSIVRYDPLFSKTIIQNQRRLDDRYIVDNNSTINELLYLSKAVTKADYRQIEGEFQSAFCILPKDIESYISKANTTAYNDKMIPSMSAVKTNNCGRLTSRRFWYNLPSLTSRHLGEVFIPRVNGEKVIARMNQNNYVIDANFTSFWRTKECHFTQYGLLAILNSKWFCIQYEEVGSVMGGGALKLDAVQLHKVFIPVLSDTAIKKMNELGKELAKSKIDSSNKIINKVDSLILLELGDKRKSSNSNMNEILNNYSSNRAK